MLDNLYSSDKPYFLHSRAMDHQWNPMGGFQPQHQHQHHHTPGAATPYMPTPDQEIALARSQMFESVHNLSVSLRNAANQCDNFVKIIARHHPSAAATAFASNVGADFLALASGTNLGAQSLANHAVAAAAPNVGVPQANAAPGRKTLSKEEKKAARKERKANRDPNAPKRPPSAYLLFQNEIRENMRAQHKELTYSEVLTKISEAWKALTEEERKVYQDRTMENMSRWTQEKREFASGGMGDFGAQDDVDGEEAAAAAAAAAGQELLSNGLINVGDSTQDDEAAVAAAAAAVAAAPSTNKRKGTSIKPEKRSKKAA